VGQAADELRDAGDIREDIERTRDDMAETLDAIGDRVSPRLQAERQMDRLRERGIEPKQVAMAAGALLMGLLLIRRRRRSHGDG
jgi:MYXO-CTERM domain-containing protein